MKLCNSPISKRFKVQPSIIGLFFIPLLTVCGGGSAESEEPAQSDPVQEEPSKVLAMSKVYSDETQAPACAEAERGNLIFLLDNKKFKYCSADNTYVELTIKVPSSIDTLASQCETGQVVKLDADKSWKCQNDTDTTIANTNFIFSS